MMRITITLHYTNAKEPAQAAQSKPTQVRFGDHTKQLRKTRSTLKQKMKKSMGLKNIYYYLPPMLESASGDVVKISTPIFTWLVMAGAIPLETAIHIWILVVIARVSIAGLCAIRFASRK